MTGIPTDPNSSIQRMIEETSAYNTLHASDHETERLRRLRAEALRSAITFTASSPSTSPAGLLKIATDFAEFINDGTLPQ